MVSDTGHYETVEYSNEGGASRATERVMILSLEEHGKLYPKLGPSDFHDSNSTLGSEGWKTFYERLKTELRARVKPGDVIVHTFGRALAPLVKVFPEQIHLETPVGNNDRPFGAYRIFESEAWRHYCLGRFETMRDPYDGQLMFPREPGLARNYSWSVQNCRDAKQWPIGDGSGDYVLFMGRICAVKGTDLLAEIVRRWDKKHPDDGLKFVLAGQGDFDRFATLVMRGDTSLARRIDFAGHVTGADRAELVGKARMMVCPTQYCEPGGGAAIEAMLCGTPVAASSWGCFVESVLHGITGYVCATKADWIAAIENVGNLSRRTIAQVARERHSFEAAAPQFDRILRTLEMLLADDESRSLTIP